jgi:hypothetical protein
MSTEPLTEEEIEEVRGCWPSAERTKKSWPRWSRRWGPQVISCR